VGEARRPDTTFWAESGSVLGERLTLDREESRHLLRVHRAHPGTPFEAVDGHGNTYHCVLESAEDGNAVGHVERREVDRGELGFTVHLLVGLPDPAAAETVVAHAVPLGVSALDFAVCERSGRHELGDARLERLGRLARSGVKQSRRSRLPAIRSSRSLSAAVADLPSGKRFAADPSGGLLRDEVGKVEELDVILAVGPPGGFSDPELDLLRSHQFSLISLGPSRLTSETAAIALLASYRNLVLPKSLRAI
jgi:16S rRNA (uracil1498-N3)-methyltransferase